MVSTKNTNLRVAAGIILDIKRNIGNVTLICHDTDRSDLIKQDTRIMENT